MQIFSEEMKAQIEEELCGSVAPNIMLPGRELYLALLLTKIGESVTAIPSSQQIVFDDWMENGLSDLKEISPTAAKAIEELNLRELYHL